VVTGMSKVTIKDVAREAGVSIGTVSNALNGVKYINPDTKQKVMDAVEKLHYVPNLNGRFLKAKSTKMIGFFTNSIAGPYFCTLLDYLSKACWKKGYNLAVFVTKETSVIMENMMGGRLDGAIIFEDTAIHEGEIERICNSGVAVVFLDRECVDENIGSIVFDSYKGSYEATKYLLNLGHRKIAFIESVDDMLDSIRRKEGYIAALKEHDIEVQDKWILKGYFEEELTYNAVKTYTRFFSEDMPTAFLAGNDLSAIGCIKALRSDGYMVPQDISVIGFDDIDIAQYFNPPLTTVRNPIARQATESVDMLLGIIEGERQGELQRLEGEIIVRESTRIYQK